MFNALFPISEYWSWLSFFLYLTVGYIVCKCCKYGAISKARNSIDNSAHYRINAHMWYVLGYILLVLFSTVRSFEVGPDTRAYVYMFQNQTSIRFSLDKLLTFNQYEPGFQYFNYFVRQITDNYHIYFLIVYSFVAYAYIKYIKRFYDENSNYIFIYLFIFYYFLNLSGIRGSIGVGFLLLSFIKLEDKKIIHAILLTILAATFHYTMIYNLYIIAVIYVLNNKKMDDKKWIWLVAVIIVTYISTARLSALTGMFSDTKYGNYSSVSLQDKSLLGSVFYLLSALICFYCYKELSKKEHKHNRQFIISLAFLITYPVLYVTSAYRIPNYYIMPRLTIWDDSLQIISEKTKINYGVLKLVAKIIVLLYLLFRFTRTAVDGHFIYIIDI